VDVVAVGVAAAFGSVDVLGVVVGLLLPCARAAVEKSDNAANVVSRTERFSDICDDRIAMA
jgi:hypothetical protein